MWVCEYSTPIISILWAPLEGVEAHFVGRCCSTMESWLCKVAQLLPWSFCQGYSCIPVLREN